MKRKTAITLGVLLLAGLCTAAATLLLHGKTGSSAALRTALVTRGSLSATICTTGTIEPEEVVDVGAPVGGQINLIGTDTHEKIIHAIEHQRIVEQEIR